jgi:hypothetical protein
MKLELERWGSIYHREGGNRREKAVEVEVGNVSLLVPLAGCYCYLTAVPGPVQVLFNGIDNKDALSLWSHIARSTIPLPNIRSRLWICSIIIHTGRAAPAPTSLHSTCEALFCIATCMPRSLRSG